MKNYLPLGSVVKLKQDGKKVMIYGRAQVAKQSGKMYDYLACLYPQGFFQANMLLCFNHDQIAEVVFEGYADEEEAAYIDRLNALFEEYTAAQSKQVDEQAAQAENGRASDGE